MIAEFCDVSAAKAAAAKPVAQLGDEVNVRQRKTNQHPNRSKSVHIIISHVDDPIPPLVGAEASAQEQSARSPTALSWEYGSSTAQDRQLSAANMCIGPQLTMYPMFFSPTMSTSIPYVLDSFVASPQGSTPLSTAQITPAYRGMRSPFQTPPSPALTIQKSLSPSRSMNEYNRLDSRRQNALRVNRLPYQSSSSNHNHVDVDRIREGIDVRTTVLWTKLKHLERTANCCPSDNAKKYPQQGGPNHAETHRRRVKLGQIRLHVPQNRLRQ